MYNERASVISAIAHQIDACSRSSPVRVAIDGRTASGKTTLADELALWIDQLGRPTIRASVDGFHRPKAERYRRGRMSAEGYYHDARNLDDFIRLLLAPLGPDGDRMIRTESFDLDTDQPIDGVPWLAPENAVLVVDGTFLQRPELAPHWDIAIYVSTDPTTCMERGMARDSHLLGGAENARQMYLERYQPAYALYTSETDPETSADLILDNDNPQAPILRVGPGSRICS